MESNKKLLWKLNLKTRKLERKYSEILHIVVLASYKYGASPLWSLGA